MTRRDWLALLCLAITIAGLILYRHTMIEPRHWGATCAAADAPWVCAIRAAFLWLQHWELYGAGALALGIAAVLGAPFAVAIAAVGLGAAAAINYNASWGLLGLALGAWRWIRMLRPAREDGAPKDRKAG